MSKTETSKAVWPSLNPQDGPAPNGESARRSRIYTQNQYFNFRVLPTLENVR